MKRMSFDSSSLLIWHGFCLKSGVAIIMANFVGPQIFLEYFLYFVSLVCS